MLFAPPGLGFLDLLRPYSPKAPDPRFAPLFPDDHNPDPGIFRYDQEDTDPDPGFSRFGPGPHNPDPGFHRTDIDFVDSYPARHPDDPPSLDAYPMGRPPLTQAQTQRGYARMLGVDPAMIDPVGMTLKRGLGDDGQRTGEGPVGAPSGLLTTAGMRQGGLQGRQQGPFVPENEPGPMNQPYDPESDAVRGSNWAPLSPDMKERLRERIKGTRFENMDLDSLKIHVGETPWYMPSDKGAITLEDHIYIAPSASGRFNPHDSEEDFNMLTEEAVHSGQFQLGMTRPGYLWEALRNGYEGSIYEQEAKRIAYPDYRPPDPEPARPTPPPREDWERR
ncbi:hypothetical protein [Fundidesulfovibrio agrisoli]|uniref:hypothetical protein n=1 Tax=Fundidesulfovibrio agrisoli TaxID=2922717 RepID=UPI001FAC98E1|nr:hypothetical protein [Fundidesulfovibrio agrisoli]